jgi:hypothetical protein
MAALGAKTGVPFLAKYLASKRGADATYGFLAGAGNGDNGNRFGSALIGAGSGFAGGEAARHITRGVGNAARGVRDESVQYLNSKGIPMTVGRVIGGPFRKVEDAATSLPLAGDTISNRQTDSLLGLNRVAFDEGLAPIGANVGGKLGNPAVDAALLARSKGYNDALDPVTLRLTPKTGKGIAAARKKGEKLPGEMSGRSTYAIDAGMENVDPNGIVTGEAFQQFLRRARKTTAENVGLPNGADLAGVMNQAEGSFMDMARRQAPQIIPGLERANAANRNVSVLKDAVNRARNGTSGEVEIFTTSQLRDAGAMNAKRFGGTEGTTDQPFYDLTRHAQRVLPSKIPDSGTARRLVQAGVGSGLLGAGGGIGALSGDNAASGAGTGAAATLGILGLLAAGGSKGGQKVMTKMLLDRPDRFVRIGDKIYDKADLLTPIGAGAGVGVGLSLSGR